MITSFGNTRFAEPADVPSKAKIEAEQEPVKPAVIGDPWEWYNNELEKVLGKQRAMDFIYADSWYITEHLKNRPSETDIVLESEDRDSFPIEHAPKFIRDLSEDLAKYSSVPVSIPFLSVDVLDSPW